MHPGQKTVLLAEGRLKAGADGGVQCGPSWASRLSLLMRSSTCMEPFLALKSTVYSLQDCTGAWLT
jgi:hypothetical protein